MDTAKLCSELFSGINTTDMQIGGSTTCLGNGTGFTVDNIVNPHDSYYIKYRSDNLPISIPYTTSIRTGTVNLAILTGGGYTTDGVELGLNWPYIPIFNSRYCSDLFSGMNTTDMQVGGGVTCLGNGTGFTVDNMLHITTSYYIKYRSDLIGSINY